MLKITTRTAGTTTVFELEGRLAGPWVEELVTCWRDAAASGGVVEVKLNAVTFIDDAGRNLLAEMNRRGIRLTAVGCMTTSIVEEIIRETNHE